MALELQEIKDFMYQLIKSSEGMKKWKATDLHKACIEKWGDEEYNKRKEGKVAIKELVEEGKLVYTYFGGSFIEIPHREGAAND
jgi:hypothetical protein